MSQENKFGDASDARIASAPDILSYTLTSGQALERFVAARRKPPSQRTLQRYRVEDRLSAPKIRMTDDQPRAVLACEAR